MAHWNSANGAFQQNTKSLHETTAIVNRHGDVIDSFGSGIFYLEVAQGQHLEYSFVHKSGYNKVTSDGETIWMASSAYPWSAWGSSNNVLYIASNNNNANDRGLEIRIEGLDSNFEEVSQTVTLNASNSTTAVATENKFYRINRFYTDNGVVNQGVITARVTSGAGTVVEYIEEGFGNSFTAIYTVPAGKTAYVIKGNISTSSNDVVGFKVRYNTAGGAFRFVHIATVDNTNYGYDFPFPLPMPEKTDLVVDLIEGGGRATCNFDLLLETNS